MIELIVATTWTLQFWPMGRLLEDGFPINQYYGSLVECISAAEDIHEKTAAETTKSKFIMTFCFNDVLRVRVYPDGALKIEGKDRKGRDI